MGGTHCCCPHHHAALCAASLVLQVQAVAGGHAARANQVRVWVGRKCGLVVCLAVARAVPPLPSQPCAHPPSAQWGAAHARAPPAPLSVRHRPHPESPQKMPAAREAHMATCAMDCSADEFRCARAPWRHVLRGAPAAAGRPPGTAPTAQRGPGSASHHLAARPRAWPCLAAGSRACPACAAPRQRPEARKAAAAR